MDNYQAYQLVSESVRKAIKLQRATDIFDSIRRYAEFMCIEREPDVIVRIDNDGFYALGRTLEQVRQECPRFASTQLFKAAGSLVHAFVDSNSRFI
jgi:hypothetical protein